MKTNILLRSSIALIVCSLFLLELTTGRGQSTNPCVPVPAGLIGWWPADGNANDIQAINNGTVNGATVAPGLVGQAFSFTGTNSYVFITNVFNKLTVGEVNASLWVHESADAQPP